MMLNHTIIPSVHKVSVRMMSKKKITVTDLKQLKQKQKPITMTSGYDYRDGLWLEQSNIDICLIGDSLGMVCLGYPDTTMVTMEDIVHHAKAVRRGSPSVFLTGDMPFGSYECNPNLALQNAIRLIKEGKCEAMKIIEDAIELERAGAFLIFIEGVPEITGEQISKLVKVPTIGVGAGLKVDGQALVISDIMGAIGGIRIPKFAKRFGDVDNEAVKALNLYSKMVKERSFPSHEYCYNMNEEEQAKLLDLVKKFK